MYIYKNKTFKEHFKVSPYVLKTCRCLDDGYYTFDWDNQLFKVYKECQYFSSGIYKGAAQWITVDCDYQLSPEQISTILKLNPTNIIRRKSNNHYQIQWFLSSNVWRNSSKWYSNALTVFKNSLAAAGVPNDPGNICTTVQNPYHSEFALEYHSNAYITVDEIGNDGKWHLVSVTYNDIAQYLNNSINICNTYNKAVVTTNSSSNSSSNSRNREFVRALDRLLLSAMHKGQNRADETMIEKAMATALEITGKTERLTDREIKAAVYQCERWCKSVYNKPYICNTYNKAVVTNTAAQKMAAVANLIQKCRKVLNMQQWKDGAVKVSRMTALRYSKTDFNALLAECYEFAKNVHGKLGYEKYYCLFSEVKQLYQLYHLKNHKNINNICNTYNKAVVTTATAATTATTEKMTFAEYWDTQKYTGETRKTIFAKYIAYMNSPTGTASSLKQPCKERLTNKYEEIDEYKSSETVIEYSIRAQSFRQQNTFS